MKTKLFLFVLFILPFFISSCKKSKDEELKFTTLTVEQQKQKIEDNGINFLNNIQKIEDTETYSTLQNFIDLANGSSSAPELAPVIKQLSKIASLKDNNFSIQKVIVSKEKWGKFEWNFSTKEFDTIEPYDTEKMIVLFPATKDGTTNNAEFSFTLTNSNVMIPDEKQYFPESIIATLKVDGVTLMTQNLTAIYTDGYPSVITEDLSIDKFKFSTTAKHTNKNMSTEMLFKYDKTNLMSYEIKTDGTYDKSTLDSIKDASMDIISNANVKFTVMNIGFVGSITDYKGMSDAMTELVNNYKNSEMTREQYIQQSVEILNKYLKMFGYFVDENKKFADVETYAVSYNNHYQVSLRFVMNDGSKVDVEDYVQQGFEGLQDKLQEILDNYQEK